MTKLRSINRSIGVYVDLFLPVIVNVALPGTQPGLPDYFFFLPAGRQSGTFRPLPLHHHTRSDWRNWSVQIFRSVLSIYKWRKYPSRCEVTSGLGAVEENAVVVERQPGRRSDVTDVA